MRNLVILALLILAGCHSREKALVASGFRDPDSVKFKDFHVGHGFVCGEVNAKNGFGAYGGYEEFVAKVGSAEVILAPPREGTDADQERAYRECTATKGVVRADQQTNVADEIDQHEVDADESCERAKRLTAERIAATRFQLVQKLCR